MRKPPRHPITIYREKYGLSERAFAEKVGADKTSISKVERGRRDSLSPKINLAIQLATDGELTIAQLTAWSWAPRHQRAAKVP